MMSKRIIATLMVLFLLLTGCKANNTGDFQEDDVSQTQSVVETNTNESNEQEAP